MQLQDAAAEREETAARLHDADEQVAEARAAAEVCVAATRAAAQQQEEHEKALDALRQAHADAEKVQQGLLH